MLVGMSYIHMLIWRDNYKFDDKKRSVNFPNDDDFSRENWVIIVAANTSLNMNMLCLNIRRFCGECKGNKLIISWKIP